MQTIILPGYSTKNKIWADETAKKLGGKSINWQHWSNPKIRFSAKAEAQNLKMEVGNNNIDIIAKSLGTLVASIFLKNNPQQVEKIILCGIPINDMNEDDLRNYQVLSDFDPNKIIVFQNSTDEHGGFEEVRNFLSQINPNIKIIEKPGSTHDYPYYEDFSNFLTS